MYKSVICAAILAFSTVGLPCAYAVSSGVQSAVDVSAFSYQENDDGTVTLTGCSKAGKYMIIPEEIDGKAVTGIAADAFTGLAETESVTMPDSIVTIGARAFSGCGSLTSVIVGKNTKSIGDHAFASCPLLARFSVIGGNPAFISLDGMLCSADGKELVRYAGGTEAVIPEGITAIGKGAFFGRSSLEKVTIPEGVTTIGDNAFSGCLSLASIVLPDTVTQLGVRSFMSCTSLGSAELSAALETIPEYCFNACTSLRKVKIPASVTDICSNAFFGCSELSGIYIPPTVTAIGENAIGRSYDLRAGEIVSINGFVIRGVVDTPAQGYAEKYGISYSGNPEVFYGDVNDDTYIDARDATLVLQEYAALSAEEDTTLTERQNMLADCNQDGLVDGRDATYILVEYARLSSM